MFFSSVIFFVTFAITALVYYLIPQRTKWIILLLFNLYFYIMFMGDRFIILPITTVLVYIMALFLEKVKSKAYSVPVIILFLSTLIFSLLYYKYYNFIRINIKFLYTLPEKSIITPVGISFYTLQAIGYLVDVYKSKIKAERHLGHFLVYLGFFGTVLSGPIESAKNFLPQLKENKYFSVENTYHALSLILFGLFKKVIIADRVAAYVNKIFDHPYDYSLLPVVFGIFLYSIQLYTDFSGYSLMALGFSKLLGFNIIDNFKFPYFSKSVKEFWSRWHISLSSFLREYIYFPLGGSRVKPYRHKLNNLIVFLVSGLWHGANWTFVLWGGLHGMYVIIDNILINRKIIKRYSFINTIICFLQVTIAWVFFRADTVRYALHLLKVCFIKDPGTVTNILSITPAANVILIIILVIFLFTYEYLLFKNTVTDKNNTSKKVNIAANCIMIIFIILLGQASQNSFIYFKF